MINKPRDIFLFIIALFLGVTFHLAFLTIAHKRNDRCLMNYPREAVSGKIVQKQVGFFNTYTAYIISYKGTTKMTDQECTKNMTVTISEYEHLMYGTDRE